MSVRGLPRLRRLLDAARGVAADAALVPELVASTGLSVEGVRLALARYLETDAGDSDLETLASRATPASRVHVILSANVFTAPLRAIAFACASGGVVTVRPSRRDPVFARALVQRATGLDLALAEDAEVAAQREGEVHVYGRDATVAAVRAAAAPGVTVRAHGAGMGLAMVSVRADVDEAALAIADDVIVFDQRGCLSPRVVLLVGDVARGERFAAALHARLAELGTRVPRGALDATEARDAARYLETLAFAGAVLRGPDHAVGLLTDNAPLVVPPSGRHVHVAVASDVASARELLAPIASQVVAIGCDDIALVQALTPSDLRVRASALGRMQRPPLDGPVDLR